MKRLLLISAVSFVALSSAPAMARDVGVSISIGQPGFYGNVDIGRYPDERVVYARPVVTYVPAVSYQPVYAYPRYGRYCAPRYRRHEYYEHHGWGGRDFDRDDGDWRRHDGHGRGRDH